MRPVSIFSATLCGVLWVSAGTIVSVAAQAAPPPTSTTTTTTQASTTSASTKSTPDYRFECFAVYLQIEPCQAYCRTKGVVEASTAPGCQKSPVPSALVLDNGVTKASMETRTITDDVAGIVLTTITLANGMPLYDVTMTLNGVTSVVQMTRGVSESTSTGSSSEATHTNRLPSSFVGFISTTVTAGSDDSTATSGVIRATSSGGGGGGGKSNAGAIAGGVVGGILGLLLIIAAVFFIRRRKNRSTPPDEFSSLEKSRGENSPQSTTPQIPITSYDSPTAAAPSQLQQPHPESQRSLMGSYPPPAGVMSAKQQQQVEVDEDGVSLRSPTPPLGEEEDVGSGRDYVPRLPIYHRGSDETPRRSAL